MEIETILYIIEAFLLGVIAGILLCWRKVIGLFDAIKHGDDQHRAWLKKAIKDHFKG